MPAVCLLLVPRRDGPCRFAMVVTRVAEYTGRLYDEVGEVGGSDLVMTS